MSSNHINTESESYFILIEIKKKLIELLNETLMLFLPPFNVAKPEL